MADEVENFFGCYMLVCENPKYKGHTYIGFTVDPNRRVKQHNKGVKAGGARRTSKKGPWSMVLIIYGFPNEIAALRFEWAWQHPERSRRLRFVKSKQSKETRFQFRIRVVSEMLRAGPWNRLPLTIRWLEPEYALEFEPNLSPPVHMPVVYGPVVRKKVIPQPVAEEETNTDRSPCYICKLDIKCTRELATCLLPECLMTSHLTCLAGQFLGYASKQLIPVEGSCPKCKNVFLWGDIVRHKQGCYRDLGQSGSQTDMSVS